MYASTAIPEPDDDEEPPPLHERSDNEYSSDSDQSMMDVEDHYQDED
jgi:hypothetical protein